MGQPVPPRGVVPGVALAQDPVVHAEPLSAQQHAQSPGRALERQPGELRAHVVQVGQGVVEDGEAEAERRFPEKKEYIFLGL